ncbi:MAG: hypothetical protein ABH828_05750 [archaeon]
MKKTDFAFIGIIVILVVLTAVTSRPNNDMEDLSGKVIQETENIEDVDIMKSDLELCCSFLDENNNEKSCYAMNNFGCNYCNSVC